MAPSASDPRIKIRRAKLLRPQPGPWEIPRQRLTSRLDEGLARPLTLVSGPAGYGKTALLSGWLAAAPAPFAWLTLDETDGDLPTFVAALVAAIQTVVPDAGQTTRSLLSSARPPAAEALATELGDDLIGLSEDLILVLDDYQSVAGLKVHDFLAGLLRHPAPRLHLYVSTRIDPPLPLARLRAHGQLAEIRTSDLRFTYDETLAFLRRAARDDLDAQTVDRLHARFEGWITGLHLAALALSNRPAPAFPEEPGPPDVGRAAMDFLADEVVGSQPDGVQQFLLQVAAPTRLCADLCQYLVDLPLSASTCQAMLERIERAGLFLVRLDEDGSWFRFHHLFRELLLRRLEALGGASARTRSLRRASAWFIEHGLVDDARLTFQVADRPAGPLASAEDAREHDPIGTLRPALDLAASALAGGVASAGLPSPAPPAPLTERELEVLHGLTRRLSNKEIAEELAISPLTVKRHATNIYGKLGVSGRRQAIRRAAAIGLAPTG